MKYRLDSYIFGTEIEYPKCNQMSQNLRYYFIINFKVQIAKIRKPLFRWLNP